MMEMEDIPITKEEYIAMVKTINQLRKEKHHLIDKACKWLRASTILADTTIERFKQALTEIEDENEDEKIRKMWNHRTTS